MPCAFSFFCPLCLAPLLHISTESMSYLTYIEALEKVSCGVTLFSYVHLFSYLCSFQELVGCLLINILESYVCLPIRPPQSNQCFISKVHVPVEVSQICCLLSWKWLTGVKYFSSELTPWYSLSSMTSNSLLVIILSVFLLLLVSQTG